MTQAPLFIAIHLIGLAMAFLLGSSRRPALMCALAFPTGLAATVMVALLILVLHVPYNAWTLGGGLLAALVGLAVWRKPALPDRAALRLAGSWTAAFALVSLALSYRNFSLMTYDGHHMVMLGNIIGRDGALESRTISELQAWGVFQVVAQSLSAFTRQDYLYSLQPVLGVSFLPAFALCLWEATGLEGASGRGRAAAVALVTAALFTLYVFTWNMVFVHTNLGTAIYLFGYVALFWLMERQRDPAGMPLCFLFLVAVALQRLETPGLALIAFAATALTTELPRRAITPLFAVFSVVVTGWYVLLARNVTTTTQFLTPERAIYVVVGMTGFFAWWLVSGRPWARRVNRWLPFVGSAIFALALAAAFILKPDHMKESLHAWGTNLLSYWGYAWYAIPLIALLAFLTPRFEHARAFSLTIWFNLAYTLLLAYPRVPYRIALVDSANRMTVHVLPLLFFYIGVKALPALRPEQPLAEP